MPGLETTSLMCCGFQVAKCCVFNGAPHKVSWSPYIPIEESFLACLNLEVVLLLFLSLAGFRSNPIIITQTE